MIAAKAFFVVTAGIIPEEPDPALSRQWSYTSVDYEADKAAIDAMVSNGPGGTKYVEYRRQALAYAGELMNPSLVNWVRLEFIWV
jgi:hypothetical protein